MSEIEAKLPNIRWQLGLDINEEKADKMGIRLVDIDSNNTLLCISLYDLPAGYSVEEYIDYIQKEGIVIKNTKTT